MAVLSKLRARVQAPTSIRSLRRWIGGRADLSASQWSAEKDANIEVKVNKTLDVIVIASYLAMICGAID